MGEGGGRRKKIQDIKKMATEKSYKALEAFSRRFRINSVIGMASSFVGRGGARSTLASRSFTRENSSRCIAYNVKGIDHSSTVTKSEGGRWATLGEILPSTKR